MRSVIVTAHDYGDLKLVHTARRLYQRSATSMSTKDKQDLARRFSEAYKLLKERYKDTGFPEDVRNVLAKVREMCDCCCCVVLFVSCELIVLCSFLCLIVLFLGC